MVWLRELAFKVSGRNILFRILERDWVQVICSQFDARFVSCLKLRLTVQESIIGNGSGLLEVSIDSLGCGHESAELVAFW